LNLDMDGLLKALGGLAAVLVPLWLIARAMRGGSARGQGGRRLTIGEVVALDQRRRVVLVRCDGRELLLLTGGSQDTVIGWLPERPAS
jgi:flagellar protein FliO/FliZ